MIRVSNLKNQTGVAGPHPFPFLKCFQCSAEYSANAGDYFMARPDHVFKCCGKPMKLVYRREAPATVRRAVSIVFEVLMYPRVFQATLEEEIREVLAREFDRYIDGEILVKVTP